MMHRFVVKKEIVDFMRQRQKKLSGKLGELEASANQDGVPIIPHETVMFLQFLLQQLKPKRILEIGTAIGFSASLMAQFIGEQGKITTIDRFDIMIKKAKMNFANLQVTDQVELLEGQAADIFPQLTETYDFIFMDCAKSKYLTFLPECLRLLRKEGVLMVDDIFQGGTILWEESEIPRKNRGIHRNLNKFLETVMNHPSLTSCILPLGDGVIMITKNEDEVDL